jgi:ABC-2 type transport system ATP-binding protein
MQGVSTVKDTVVLKTQNLKKYFGSVHAVENLSFEVRRGEIFGFLGPNGAGKTTAISMMLGLLYPTGGTVEVFGQRVTPQHPKALTRVGALVGATPALFPFLSAGTNLELVAKMHPEVPRQRIIETLELVKVEHDANRPAGRFSTGMKQRLGLAMALIHKPDLLILDEPTNGMDPAGMRDVRGLLRTLADSGITIFISSHLLHEIELICDRVAVVKAGLLVAQGTVQELVGKQTASVKVRVEVPATAAAALADLRQVKHIEAKGAYITVQGATSQQIIAHLAAKGILPVEVTTTEGDLESLFLEMTAEAA